MLLRNKRCIRKRGPFNVAVEQCFLIVFVRVLVSVLKKEHRLITPLPLFVRISNLTLFGNQIHYGAHYEVEDETADRRGGYVFTKSRPEYAWLINDVTMSSIFGYQETSGLAVCHGLKLTK